MNFVSGSEGIIREQKLYKWATIKGEPINGKRQILCQVKGRPGCGKSFCIQAARAEPDFSQNVVLCAPTGSAASIIGGVTANSLFKLPIMQWRHGDLKPKKRRELRATLEPIKCIIIDEKSMISQIELGYIDRRLRNIWGPDEPRHKLPFGGFNIFLFGDFRQPAFVIFVSYALVYQIYCSARHPIPSLLNHSYFLLQTSVSIIIVTITGIN